MAANSIFLLHVTSQSLTGFLIPSHFCNCYANVRLETHSMILPVGTPNGVSVFGNTATDAPLRVPTIRMFFITCV